MMSRWIGAGSQAGTPGRPQLVRFPERLNASASFGGHEGGMRAASGRKLSAELQEKLEARAGDLEEKLAFRGAGAADGCRPSARVACITRYDSSGAQTGPC
jgi:hypothetical protein